MFKYAPPSNKCHTCGVKNLISTAALIWVNTVLERMQIRILWHLFSFPTQNHSNCLSDKTTAYNNYIPEKIQAPTNLITLTQASIRAVYLASEDVGILWNLWNTKLRMSRQPCKVKIWKSSSTNKARRVENQQTQPTYGEEDRIETRPVLLPLPLQGKKLMSSFHAVYDPLS